MTGCQLTALEIQQKPKSEVLPEFAAQFGKMSIASKIVGSLVGRNWDQPGAEWAGGAPGSTGFEEWTHAGQAPWAKSQLHLLKSRGRRLGTNVRKIFLAVRVAQQRCDLLP